MKKFLAGVVVGVLLGAVPAYATATVPGLDTAMAALGQAREAMEGSLKSEKIDLGGFRVKAVKDIDRAIADLKQAQAIADKTDGKGLPRKGKR